MNKKKRFGKIYDNHVEEIYRFVFLKVSTRDIAQDITSETFKKGWEIFKKNPDMENPRAYLYKVARNLVIDHYRTKKQHLSPDNLDLESEEKDLVEKANLSGEMRRIKKAMENLKDNYQDVIIHKYLEEMSNSEIAEIMDKSEGAVRVLAHRAITALEEELENMEKSH